MPVKDGIRKCIVNRWDLAFDVVNRKKNILVCICQSSQPGDNDHSTIVFSALHS